MFDSLSCSERVPPVRYALDGKRAGEKGANKGDPAPFTIAPAIKSAVIGANRIPFR